MKIADVKVGNKYIAKVSGKLTVVRVLKIRESFSSRRVDFNSRVSMSRSVIDVVNEATGRKLTFRSAAKLRRPAAGDTVKVRKRGGAIGMVTAVNLKTVAVRTLGGKTHKFNHNEIRIVKPQQELNLQKVKEVSYRQTLEKSRSAVLYEVPANELVAANKDSEVDALDSAQTRINRGEKARVIYNRTQGKWQVLIPKPDPKPEKFDRDAKDDCPKCGGTGIVNTPTRSRGGHVCPCTLQGGNQ